MSRLASEVKVVPDSASDIPVTIARDLGITVVPDNVHFGQRTYRDGVDLTKEEFFIELAKSPVLPTTSQPAVGVFEEVYRQLGREARQIVSIHLPAKLSAVLDSAHLAAQSLPDGRSSSSTPLRSPWAWAGWSSSLPGRRARGRI